MKKRVDVFGGVKWLMILRICIVVALLFNAPYAISIIAHSATIAIIGAVAGNIWVAFDGLLRMIAVVAIYFAAWFFCKSLVNDFRDARRRAQ